MTKLDPPPNPQFHTRQPITKPSVDDPYSSVKVSVRGLLGKWVTYNENWFCFFSSKFNFLKLYSARWHKRLSSSSLLSSLLLLLSL